MSRIRSNMAPESVSFFCHAATLICKPSVGIRIQTPAGDQGRKERGYFISVHLTQVVTAGHCWSLPLVLPVFAPPCCMFPIGSNSTSRKKFSRPIECVRISESIGLDALPCHTP